MSIRDTVSFGSYFSNNCLMTLHANPDGHSVVWALINIPIKLGESSAVVRFAKAMAFLFFAIFCFSAIFASVFNAAPSDAGRSGSSVWPTACLNFHTVAKAENRNHHVWKWLWSPLNTGNFTDFVLNLSSSSSIMMFDCGPKALHNFASKRAGTL